MPDAKQLAGQGAACLATQGTTPRNGIKRRGMRHNTADHVYKSWISSLKITLIFEAAVPATF